MAIALLDEGASAAVASNDVSDQGQGEEFLASREAYLVNLVVGALAAHGKACGQSADGALAISPKQLQVSACCGLAGGGGGGGGGRVFVTRCVVCLLPVALVVLHVNSALRCHGRVVSLGKVEDSALVH